MRWCDFKPLDGSMRNSILCSNGIFRRGNLGFMRLVDLLTGVGIWSECCDKRIHEAMVMSPATQAISFRASKLGKIAAAYLPKLRIDSRLITTRVQVHEEERVKRKPHHPFSLSSLTNYSKLVSHSNLPFPNTNFGRILACPVHSFLSQNS